MAMQPLGDDDRMPFGKHKGERMEDIPVAYLHYLWTSGLRNDSGMPVHEYIKERLDELKKEYPEGMWDEEPGDDAA